MNKSLNSISPKKGMYLFPPRAHETCTKTNHIMSRREKPQQLTQSINSTESIHWPEYDKN